MSDKPTSRRQFLKGLGMVTGAFATGAFALNSSANEEGVVYNETPSGVPCFWINVIKNDSGAIPDPKDPKKQVYHVRFTYVSVCNGNSSASIDLTLGNYPTEADGKKAMNNKINSLYTNLKPYCSC